MLTLRLAAPIPTFSINAKPVLYQLEKVKQGLVAPMPVGHQCLLRAAKRSRKLDLVSTTILRNTV